MRHNLIIDMHSVKNGGAIKLGNFLHPMNNHFKNAHSKLTKAGHTIKNSFDNAGSQIANEFNKLKIGGGPAHVKLLKGINDDYGISMGDGARRKRIKPLKFKM